MDLEDAIKAAKTARQNVYAPYSKYFVGAALKGKSGKIYSGCNIENDGISSICAERTAFVKALSEGEKEFEYIVICGSNDSTNERLDSITPCRIL